MSENTVSVFEKHPKKTLMIALFLLSMLLYGLSSLKLFNNQYTEFESKNLKTILHQYFVGRVVENNVGRFIKLREHSPETARYERPSRNYISHIAPNTVERKYYKISTDRHGFIGPSEIHTNPDIKIVFLGGSTTECLYMQEQERFPYLVGRQLEKSLAKKVNTYNGGVSANESMHSLNILMNKVLPMKPQIVVFMHNINDLVILRSQGTYWYENSLKSHVQSKKTLLTRYEFPENHHEATESDLMAEFSRNLRTFIAICRIRDIQPILMTQANRVENDALYHRFNEIIREVGKQEQVKVIDLATAIPKETDYLYDSYHYTAKGAALAANTIAEQLQKVLS
ncbi:GDSL-type esterase/lipase family protein [Candidatus Berkiella aquae]|uniref:SGNH/GDSL hydrolase family protein n=1 Tax=Candidatus Berkiella aquae TaxID=295108 RepID=A0A0Q9YT20_9GAMM|nr:SGNH/GDSL hydrolase family protein [Candidatus Berkiella aquae]MCS5710790.1 SGNH/GDSL hydrolase family protein [Candidatus Berkiella aquae]